jgi:tetratricopeptide (TPR) repeat protein
LPAAAPAPSASSLIARGEQLLEAGRYDEAAQAFEAALRSRPGERAARVGKELARGFAKLAEGDRISAAQCFEAALEIDPMNERAARELSAMRRAATDQRRGLLGKLLGKT